MMTLWGRPKEEIACHNERKKNEKEQKKLGSEYKVRKEAKEQAKKEKIKMFIIGKATCH